ncbi:MAG: biopolymer transporter ExbD [Alphaproteobacteria bacterium]|nr:biopolymer transporter ExbD [Alphaproteobacteria bacterium]MCB9698039.1 biopolymer transporter ExbD [Alphaproteobacteria bacterium]
MKLPHRKRREVTLNLSPLIDVIFILLIFVVLVAKFADQERIDVDLPSAEAGRPAEVDALLVEVDADGQVWVEGQLVARDALFGELEAARRRYHRAVLVADRTTSLQSAVDVISTAKLVGFDAVAVATKPPEP